MTGQAETALPADLQRAVTLFSTDAAQVSVVPCVHKQTSTQGLLQYFFVISFPTTRALAR